ncbi:MAG: CotH kinase family protein [Bacteroidota bacterium]
MKSYKTTFILLLFSSFMAMGQGRGDRIFDESFLHEIRISTARDLSALTNIFYEEWSAGEYTYTLASVVIDGNLLDSIGVRVKGGISSFDIKKPLKLDFNSFVSGQRYDGIKKLNLHQGNMDPSFIREAISYGLMRNAGVKTVRTSFANIYYNNEYQGVYTLVEQIDDNFIKDRFASNKGALYKTGQHGLELKYEEDNSLPYADFVSAVNQIPTNQLHEELEEYLDVESFLRFFVLQVFVNAVDGPLTVDYNYNIYYEPKSKTYVYIPWDYNLSLYGGANHPLFPSGGSLLNRTFNNTALRDRYLNIFCQLFDYNFDLDRLQNIITIYRTLLENDIPNDPYLEQIGDWEAGMEDVRNVITERYTTLLNELETQLNSCPPLEHALEDLDIVINEIVASNDVNSNITDPDGGSADWIELYNNTSEDVDLSQFYLSNDKDVLKHWRFPKGTILPAKDYLIIWADRDIDEEGIHSDFKLNKSQGELYLSFENGDIIDSLSYSDQETNIGLARVPNGKGPFIVQKTTFNTTNDLSTSNAQTIQKYEYKLFPNPIQVGDDLNILCTTNDLIQVQFSSLNGSRIWQGELNSNDGIITLPTSNLELQPGMYHIELLNKRIKNRDHRILIVH